MDLIDNKVSAVLSTVNFSENGENGENGDPLNDLLEKGVLNSSSTSSDGLNASSLRMNVESSSLSLSIKFEKLLKNLVDGLEGLDEEVGTIRTLAEGISKSSGGGSYAGGGKSDLDSDGRPGETPAMLISRVVKERDDAVARMNAVKAFLSKFEINERTERALDPSSFSAATGSRGGKDFLSALTEVGEARENLRSAFDGTNPDTDPSAPNVGIRMLEKLADQQEKVSCLSSMRGVCMFVPKKQQPQPPAPPRPAQTRPDLRASVRVDPRIPRAGRPYFQ
jgi:hypothetical protein